MTTAAVHLAGIRPPAGQALLDVLLDAGSFVSWDRPAQDPTDERVVLAAARRRSGADEAVRTGVGRISGRAVAVICSEFAFLGGTIGAAAADRIVSAVRRATREQLPLLALPASGGTRVHEGTPAFLRMVDISVAVLDHKQAGLPYLVHLRNPTTGGVLASWGSLGHLTTAEPGATIGFLGPKVYAALHHGERFPDGVQTAENLRDHGLIDMIVPDHELGALIGRILNHLQVTAARPDARIAVPRTLVGPRVASWAAVTKTRRADRPGLRELLRCSAIAPAAMSDPGRGITLTLARFGETSCVVVGQDRVAQTTTPIEPRDLATARRGIKLAADLGLPLITVIDTPGAGLSVDAEQAGLAQQIAHCLAELIIVSTPTISILLGQGAGGAALALLPADRVLAAQHSWLTPLPPEGASQIVYRSTRRGPDITATQRCTSSDLVDVGVVDRIVPDSPEDPVGFIGSLAAALESEIAAVTAAMADPSGNRINRWDRLGRREKVRIGA